MTILGAKISKHLFSNKLKGKSQGKHPVKWQELLYLMYEEFLKLFFKSF